MSNILPAPTASTFFAAPIYDAEKAVYDFTIPANKPWSHVVLKGQVLRIVDLEGQQAVDTLFYNAHDTSERYSAQDTILTQGGPYVTTGTRLISNEGNMLGVIVADSCGRHDTSAGACSCEANTVRFGHHTRYMHACRENFLIAVSKHGMTKRDIVPNINFFMNVPIEPDGSLAIVDGVSRPGDYVDILATTNIIAVISNCPQINNPCNGFNPTPVRVTIFDPAIG
ncbi:urea amidolyase associated protein UAAP2 [Methylocystis parvus]|uniref:urea amidolyase associated protein UAAP2 n=1 Tax=Methylocystis parvus TaxID=134 RepID=UPI003C73CA70